MVRRRNQRLAEDRISAARMIHFMRRERMQGESCATSYICQHASGAPASAVLELVGRPAVPMPASINRDRSWRQPSKHLIVIQSFCLAGPKSEYKSGARERFERAAELVHSDTRLGSKKGISRAPSAKASKGSWADRESLRACCACCAARGGVLASHELWQWAA